MEIIVNIYLATSDSLRHAESDIFYVRPTNYLPHIQSLVPWGHCWHGDAAAREKFSQHHVGGLASWASHLFFLKYESLDGTLALGYLISSHIFCSFATLSSAHSSRLILSNNHQCQEGGVPSKVPRSHCQAAGALTYFLSHDFCFFSAQALKAEGYVAAVFTQFSDVEAELNGFFSYDRQIVKVDLNALAEMHADLISSQ